MIITYGQLSEHSQTKNGVVLLNLKEGFQNKTRFSWNFFLVNKTFQFSYKIFKINYQNNKKSLIRIDNTKSFNEVRMIWNETNL